MATPALRPLSLGEVLDVSFGIYRSHFTALFTVAVCSQLVPGALKLFINTPEKIFASPLLAMAILLLSVPLTLLGVAACTLIVSKVYLGEEITAKEALLGAMPLIGRLFLISMMTGLVVFFGFFIFIVGALVAFAGYILASAVAVIEAPIGASESMSRSWFLTKGFRFRTLVVVLVPLLLLSVPAVALSLVAGLFTDSTGLALDVIVTVVTVFFYPLFYVVVAVSYYDMRVRKEGLDLEILATAAQQE